MDIGINLPKNAVTQKIAFIGRTGSGKTYGATELAEQMYKLEAQFVVLDPVGVWWGLRLASNGKDSGISIPVFGGIHGDVPLEPGAGKLLADLVVDRGISAILDISQFEHNTDKARFAEEFATRFFFKKKSTPSAVHLFIEEAQEFLPQNPAKGEERMLGAFERLWKLGRNFGVGGSLISQRPQEVNKKALNQTECLFAFQMTGTHERKAIDAWIADKGIDEDISQILPKLEVGQARIWSPQWLKISKTIKIPLKETFNASSTPEIGKVFKKPQPLAPIELEKIKEQMKDTIEKADAENPNKLRKKVLELEAQLRKQGIAKTQVVQKNPDKTDIINAKRQGYFEAKQAYNKKFTEMREVLETLKYQAKLVESHAKKITDTIVIPQKISVYDNKEFREVPYKSKREINDTYFENKSSSYLVATKIELPQKVGFTDAMNESKLLRDGAMKMLKAVAMFHPEPITKEQIAVLSGFSSGGGTFNTYLSELKRNNWLVENRDGFEITEEGLANAGKIDSLPTDSLDLIDMWAKKFREGASKILKVVAENYPNELSKEEVGERVGQVFTGGTFNTYLSELRRAGLIEIEGNSIKATKWLFLEK